MTVEQMWRAARVEVGDMAAGLIGEQARMRLDYAHVAETERECLTLLLKSAYEQGMEDAWVGEGE